MSTTAVALPGVDRLLEVCRKHAIPIEVLPPSISMYEAHEVMAGKPLDPQLSALYKSVGRLDFKDDFFSIAQCDDEVIGLRFLNEFHLPRWPEPLNSLFIFGKEDALAYYFATVPMLSDSQGLQPIVWVDSYEDVYALPVASSVDRFFHTFSRYLELIFQTPEYRDDTDVRPNFPWGTPELLRDDQKLVGMLRDGWFDSLMYSNERRAIERTHAEVRRWVERVLTASP